MFFYSIKMRFENNGSNKMLSVLDFVGFGQCLVRKLQFWPGGSFQLWLFCSSFTSSPTFGLALSLGGEGVQNYAAYKVMLERYKIMHRSI